MISTYTLNHFGLISGICNELDIADFIDRLIPVDPQQKVTTGQAVVSMIINGPGFSNGQLYLYPQVFEKKPVELLVSRTICASDLNDDTIGRALDRVFLYGCTELFCYLS
jgi:transposase